MQMVMRGGRTGGSGREMKWVCILISLDTHTVSLESAPQHVGLESTLDYFW